MNTNFSISSHIHATQFNRTSTMLAALFLALTATSNAAILYVDLNCPSPTPPYTNWATAAVNIQDAVNAATAGDQILVTNGVYAAGGTAVFGTTSNRVAVTKPLTVRSVSGPAVTTIQGSGLLRCVYLTNGAVLSGFTLSSAALWSDIALDPRDTVGGGLLCESASAVASNCVIAGNFAESDGGGAYDGTLIQCTLMGNLVNGNGGGASSNILIRCTVTSNSAANNGGGAFECVLEESVVAGNSTLDSGGGVIGGSLNFCTLTGNSASGDGGGAAGARLTNCIVTNNWARRSGGGAVGCLLTSCILMGNQATNDFSGAGFGGGAAGGTLNNCTLVGNKARYGGGAAIARLNNSIVYFNTATYDGPNFFQDVPSDTLNYCCTWPMPASGVGNITNEPLFINLAGGNLHLQPSSPCIDAGANLSGAITNDLDGRPRPLDGNADGVAAFDLGAYEHSVLFVRQDSPSPAPPYNSWLTAATNIQDAADLTLAGAGDQILVTNGVYRSGGRADGRLVADKATTIIQSVNGPRYTVIDGGGVVRCVYLEGGTCLSGFTLTNGAAPNASGGGVAFGGMLSEAVVSNCVLVGNSAKFGGGAASALQVGGNLPIGGSLVDCVLRSNSAGGPFNPPLNPFGGAADNCKLYRCAIVGNSSSFDAGGVSASTLQNCLLTGNTAGGAGGGAIWSTLTQCTLVGNAASFCGGTYFSTLQNCINVENAVPNYAGGFLSYTCTTPLAAGIGNFTNAPLFIDPVNGNLRLQSNSPCINTGSAGYDVGSTDLDGRPRIVAGTVDMGAYEFQPGASGEFIGWLADFNLPTDGSADYADDDNDRMNNWQEWIAGTVPTDAASALRMLAPARGTPGVIVSWQSVSNRTYFLKRTANLSATIPFSLVASNLAGQAGTTTYTDTNATVSGPCFYRVGVQQ